MKSYVTMGVIAGLVVSLIGFQSIVSAEELKAPASVKVEAPTAPAVDAKAKETGMAEVKDEAKKAGTKEAAATDETKTKEPVVAKVKPEAKQADANKAATEKKDEAAKTAEGAK